MFKRIFGQGSGGGANEQERHPDQEDRQADENASGGDQELLHGRP
jgi:hypothetical protein